MMDARILLFALALLALGVALNLALSVRLLARTRALENAQAKPFTPPLGEPLPALSGRMLGRRAARPLAPPGQATVLLFLSSGCPKCRQKLAEIESLLPLLGGAGLGLSLLSPEPWWRLRRFLRGTALLPRVLRVPAGTVRRLNPTLASPYYLFVNHEGALDAGGMLGDDDWRSFMEQMGGVGAALAQVA